MRTRSLILVLASVVMLSVLASTGKAQTSFLRFGDTVRIEMYDSSGRSIFGAIEQVVEYLQSGIAINAVKFGEGLELFRDAGRP